jgi:hypothetical protein
MKAPNWFGMFKSISLLPSPSDKFLRWKGFMQPLFQDVLSMLGFVMLHVKLICSLVLVIVSSWVEKSMIISLNEIVGLLTYMWNPYKMKGTSSSRSK